MNAAGVRVILPDPPNDYDRHYMDKLVGDLERLLEAIVSPTGAVILGARGQALTGVRHGAVSLTAGQATVTHASLTASARVVVTRSARGGTPGVCYEVTPAAGSFVITARTSTDTIETGDASTISYVVVEP